MLARRRVAAVVALVGVAAGACSADVADVTSTSGATTTLVPVTTAATTATSGPTTTTAAATTSEPAGGGVLELHGGFGTPIAGLGDYFSDPIVVLEDQTQYLNHDPAFVVPTTSQVLGRLEPDLTRYSLTLPIEATALFHDVDHDDRPDPGVAVYAVSVRPNVFGDPYIDERDQFGGLVTHLSSITTTFNVDGTTRLTGGQLVVYSPDAHERFPTGFGKDASLFTADDPIGRLPAGWSVVDISETPFLVRRDASTTLPLDRPGRAGTADLSNESYTKAFDSLVSLLQARYAFTDVKQLDWTAMALAVRPRIVAAEQAHAKRDFMLALLDFLSMIPDGHVSLRGQEFTDADRAATAGGIGLGLARTDSGGVVVRHLVPGGAAERASVQIGAAVVQLDGQPIEAAISATRPWTGPFSTRRSEELDQVRYVTRFPLDHPDVELTFVNPGGDRQTASLTVSDDAALVHAWSPLAVPGPPALPVELSVLPSGYGLIRITSFDVEAPLTIQLYERALRYAADADLPGIILDVRHNPGGLIWIAEQMAADIVGVGPPGGALEERTDDGSYVGPPNFLQLVPPAGGALYHGRIAVVVDTGCASACELFATLVQLGDQVTVVGETPTRGAGGSVTAVQMPDGLRVTYSGARLVDLEGNVLVEGHGVTPQVDVPVTVASIRREEAGVDLSIEAAEGALDDLGT